MPSFEDLIKQKSKKLESVPLALQTVVEKQQKAIADEILLLLNDLETKAGQIVISKNNLELISRIDADLKKIFLNDEYLSSVKDFAKSFDSQALINDKILKETLGATEGFAASEAYVTIAKRSAVESLIGSPIDKEFIKPIQGLLENSVVNGANLKDTIDGIRDFVQGNEKSDSKILRYVKQISNDSFAIADRSYTSIVSDFLEAEWFYYAGGEVQDTRCFCEERVGKYFYYKTIESWGNGENIGDCNLGGGRWAGQIPTTNSKTIYSYLGGYNCMHSLIPVSEAIVPESTIEIERKRWNF